MLSSRMLSTRAILRRGLSSMSRMDGRAGGGHYNQGPPPQLDPTFSIFSDDCLMKLRLNMSPRPDGGSSYQRSREQQQLPRLMLEFVRKSGNSYDWTASKRIMLSTDEIGILIDCTNHEELTFVRGGEQGVPAVSKSGQSYVQRAMKKVTFSPSASGDWTVRFTGEGEELTVSVSRGKKAVLQSLIRSSLPVLFGWPPHAVQSGSFSTMGDRVPF